MYIYLDLPNTNKKHNISIEIEDTAGNKGIYTEEFYK